MAEVGLVLFAKTTLAVMREVLPAYSSKYSKHTFTQPQLMTILCLMRFASRLFECLWSTASIMTFSRPHSLHGGWSRSACFSFPWEQYSYLAVIAEY